MLCCRDAHRDRDAVQPYLSLLACWGYYKEKERKKVGLGIKSGRVKRWERVKKVEGGKEGGEKRNEKVDSEREESKATIGNVEQY